MCDEELAGDLDELCANASGPLAVGDAIDLAEACRGRGQGVGRMPPAQLAALAQVVDLNEADATELASLPGIGPVLADRIVAARPYARVEEVLEVRGIGPARLAAIRARARVSVP